jgi:autotransporter-associated beta strand protein
MKKLGLAILIAVWSCGISKASAVLFDFSNAPFRSSLPVTLTVGGVTANFTATGQGFSIQDAYTMGFAPAGFSGLCIYPNSIYAADLSVGFTNSANGSSQPLHDFSILYSDEEYGCDTSAVMKVSGYLQGVLVASNTAQAPNPGTWPSATLSLSSSQGFDSVVVHYLKPPSGENWGPIFMADNMNVTPLVPATAYWKGGNDGIWSSTSPSCNWVAAPSSTATLTALPGATTDVYFSASAASNLATTLGSDFSIQSLNFTADTGPATIGGGNMLTIANGITVASGSASHTIDANVELAATQTWTIAGPSTLSVNGQVSGIGAELIKSGSGTLILTSPNFYDGGTTVNAGMLIVTAPDAILDGTNVNVGASTNLLLSPVVVLPLAGFASTAVPEPGTFGLLVLGAASFLGFRIRRK